MVAEEVFVYCYSLILLLVKKGNFQGTFILLNYLEPWLEPKFGFAGP
jgi:hypothetical protein